MSISSSSSASSASSGSSGSLSSSSSSIAPADVRRVRLKLFTQRYFVPNKTDGFRFRIEAVDANQMPAAIFRYYRYPPDALTGEVIDECTGVCSVPDLEELPVGEPRPTDCPQAYRLAVVDQVVRGKQIALEAWELYKEEVTALKESLDAGDVLDETDSIWIGPAP